MVLDLVIRGGTVVTASDLFPADIGIRDGVVVALGDRLSDARRTIDAGGRLVLPGGVDAHCHLDEPPYGGLELADDFASGSVAAACGGTTTIIPFACQERGRPLRAAVEAYHAKAEGKSLIDYAFHLIVTEVNEQVTGQDIPALAADGYRSLKFFMTYDGFMLDDRAILDLLDCCARHGVLAMVHAENGHCAKWLAERLEAKGEAALSAHAKAAPHLVEREATHRAIAFAEATGARLMVVHVSSREALEQIRWARDRELPVHAETCPHYLVRSSTDLDRPGWEAAPFLCSPPLRESGNAEHLWRGLVRGELQIISSDHCAYLRRDGRGGEMRQAAPSFRHCAPGVAGLETRLPVMFSEGVRKNRIGLNDFVRLTATAPAKLYGLHPRKGTIAIGADADLVLWDPERADIVRAAELHGAAAETPFEGMAVTGWPVMTLSRGDVVWDDGEVVGEPGRGRFVARRS